MPRNPGPDKPGDHAEQHPGQKRTQHSDGCKHDQQTDSTTLDKRLTLISHVLPTGNQRHGINATSSMNLKDFLKGHPTNLYCFVKLFELINLQNLGNCEESQST